MIFTPNIFISSRMLKTRCAVLRLAELLLLLCPDICRAIRVVRTDPELQLPVRTGQAEVVNCSLEKYPDFTICARFRSHQFSWHKDTWAYHSVIVIPPKDWLIGAYVTHPCDDFYAGCTQRYKDIHGSQWRHSGVVGYIGDGVFNENFPVWQPGVWVSACVTVTIPDNHITIYLNGEIVFQTWQYELHLKPDANIVLMNDGASWGGLPFHGEMTDVNVWSRVLSEEEIIKWKKCEAIEAGDVVNWETVKLNLTAGVEIIEEEREKTCWKEETAKTYKAFKSKATFDEMIKLCKNIGGHIAVAEDETALSLIETTFKDNCISDEFFYTGFTDREKDREWVNVNNGQLLAWDNWAPKNPVNLSLHDCITSRLGNLQENSNVSSLQNFLLTISLLFSNKGKR